MILETNSKITEKELQNINLKVVRLITETDEKKIWKVVEIEKEISPMTQPIAPKTTATANTVIEFPGTKTIVDSATQTVQLLLSAVTESIQKNNDAILKSIAGVEETQRTQGTKIETIAATTNQLATKIQDLEKSIVGIKAIMAMIKEAIKS